MDIYNRITIADYPMTDMQMGGYKNGGFQIHNYSHGKVDRAIVIGIWNGDVLRKQTIHFTEEDFVKMMTEREEGEYIWPETAEALERNGGDVHQAFEDDELHRDEIENAVRLSGRITFRISWDELQKCQSANPGWTRKECINHLVAEKTTIPMPTAKDMPPMEEAA